MSERDGRDEVSGAGEAVVALFQLLVLGMLVSGFLLGPPLPEQMEAFAEEAADESSVFEYDAGPSEVPAMSTEALPRNKTRLVIRASQIEGYEHGFYFCADGSSGQVIEGDHGSIRNYDAVSIDCDGGMGFFHTHPSFESYQAQPSFPDRNVMKEEGFSMMCAGNLNGKIGCQRMTERGEYERVVIEVDVGESYDAGPATIDRELNETEVGK